MKELHFGSSILFAITHYHPPIRKKAIVRILIILLCLLIFLLSMTPSSAKIAIKTSAALNSVIKQAEVNFLKPIGSNFDSLAGPLDGPPAHPNCRSTISLVMP